MNTLVCAPLPLGRNEEANCQKKAKGIRRRRRSERRSLSQNKPHLEILFAHFKAVRPRVIYLLFVCVSILLRAKSSHPTTGTTEMINPNPRPVPLVYTSSTSLIFSTKFRRLNSLSDLHVLERAQTQNVSNSAAVL